MADDGKRSLFSGGRSGPTPKGEGKDALYSHDSEDHGPIKIDCARCGETTDVSILDALGRVLRFSLWIPRREYNHRLVCPACDKRSWTRIRLL